MTRVSIESRFRSIRSIHQEFEKKTISPVELVKEYISVAKKDPLGAFITVCEDRAIKQAQIAEKILAKCGDEFSNQFPLLGIPIGVKDNLTLKDVRTTCASKILDQYIPPYTATAVERLEMAGAITLGKLNLDEFGMGSSNENSAYGPVQHPTHPGYVPGGSSGGSAAAVKGGLCVAALGTDTGGSIRLPASFCGVVGVKPTYGRVSRYGLIAFASSLDQIGPISGSVEDAATLLDVMSGYDGRDSTSMVLPKTKAQLSAELKPSWSQLSVGVPKEYFSGGLSDEVEKAIQNAFKWFRTQGAKIVPISLPHTEYAVSVYYLVAVSEASSNLARYDGIRFGGRSPKASEAKSLDEFYKASRANFGPEVKRRILLGTFALSSGYSEDYYRRACQVRRLVKQDFDQAFESVDFICAPVSPTTAFKVGEKKRSPLQMYLNDIFTIPASLAGLPAMSLPCGEDQEGLPIGLQLIGSQFSEEKLFSIANDFSLRGYYAS